ncbi:ArsR/SmtB family transcription factor [Nonomuraea rubra]|uniref:ArsR/SmtB family transcription factor n=1 Tax=Nonomuraea rubra TaxID=46180 RepID=UPI0033EBE1E2
MPPGTDDCSGSVPGSPLPAQLAIDMARQLRVLADPVRLRLVSILLSRGSAGVYELTDAFDAKEPMISHHLRVLRDAGLVDCERVGVRSSYSVTLAGAQLFPYVTQLFDVP